MKTRFLFLFFLIACLACFTTACGDDDDDDNDSGDDDTSDDDTVDDDDNDNDTGIDDDDDDDNDSGDDDDDDTAPPDWSLEPLAVLDCEALTADPGDELDFEGSSSTDPNDSTLTYLLDFGDGETAESATAAHAFDYAGAYRVTLTVTNEFGYDDAASCLVQVGAFPTGAGELDTIGFRPNFFNDKIIEVNSPPHHGGVVYGAFTHTNAALADTVLVNGQVGHPDTADVEWCEILNPDLTADQVALVQCHSYSTNFDPGSSIELEVKAGAETLWTYNGMIPAPMLTPSYITADVDGDELLVYVRNDGEESYVLTGLSIDGLDVSDFVAINQELVLPDEIAIIRVPRHDGIDYGVFHAFTVHGLDERGEISATRIHRLFQPTFPLGNWDAGEDDIYHNMDNLEQQLGHGIDMHIYYPDGYNTPELVVGLAEDYDFYLFTHYGGTNPTYEQYINDYGENPQVLANAVFGEPDLSHPAIEVLGEMQLQRELWGTKKPLWGYNACAHRWPAFQPLPDIGGMDHYCVFAPKCNYNFPPFFWDHLWFLGYYCEAVKYNAEPKPVWEWTQGNSKGDLSLFYRCLTDEEIRAQWYVVLGRGVKGLLWFRFTQHDIGFCPRPLPEMKRLAQELEPVKDSLLDGDWFTTGLYAATEDETIDVQATINPTSAVIVLSNFDYDLNLIFPWVWREKTNVVVDFYPPEGFEPASFTTFDGLDATDLQWEKVDHGHWRFLVPELQVGRAVLVLPEP